MTDKAQAERSPEETREQSLRLAQLASVRGAAAAPEIAAAIDAESRAEAAEAAQAKLTEALKRIAGYANHLPPCEGGQCVCGLWGAEYAVRAALTSAASDLKGPPGDLK